VAPAERTPKEKPHCTCPKTLFPASVQVADFACLGSALWRCPKTHLSGQPCLGWYATDKLILARGLGPRCCELRPWWEFLLASHVRGNGTEDGMTPPQRGRGVVASYRCRAIGDPGPLAVPTGKNPLAAFHGPHSTRIPNQGAIAENPSSLPAAVHVTVHCFFPRRDPFLSN